MTDKVQQAEPVVMTKAKATEIVRVRYGNVRQNASTDDQVTVQRAASLIQRKATDITEQEPK